MLRHEVPPDVQRCSFDQLQEGPQRLRKDQQLQSMLSVMLTRLHAYHVQRTFAQPVSGQHVLLTCGSTPVTIFKEDCKERSRFCSRRACTAMMLMRLHPCSVERAFVRKPSQDRNFLLTYGSARMTTFREDCKWCSTPSSCRACTAMMLMRLPVPQQSSHLRPRCSQRSLFRLWSSPRRPPVADITLSMPYLPISCAQYHGNC